MYVVIAGAGKIGSQLAQILIDENCDVVVIDKDREVCKTISSELDCVAINEDASDPEVLKEAKINETDALVALTGSDQENLVICLIAKQAGAKNVIARLSKMHYDEKVLKKIGIDTAVYPESAAAAYISEVVTKPNVLDLGFVTKGSADILEVKITGNSSFKNKFLREIRLPQGCSIIAVAREGKISALSAEMQIKENDVALVLTPIEKIEEMRRIVKVSG